MQLTATDSSTLAQASDASRRVSLAQIQPTRAMQKQAELESREHMQLLVAESTIATRVLVSTLLQREGYHVHTAGTGDEVRQIVRQHGLPDLAILGVRLPDCEGESVARELRQQGETPIIYLTNNLERVSQGQLLPKQTDEYLAKPFSAADLLARVRHRLLRRSLSPAPPAELAVDERFRINLAQEYALLDDKRIELTPIETRLLDALFQHRGRVLSPGFLLSKAWNRRQEGTLRSLGVHIRRLRRKIEPDAQHPRYVMTVRGQGYCLPRRPELDVIIK
jgi:DNA-binding response OmpR family regulator